MILYKDYFSVFNVYLNKSKNFSNIQLLILYLLRLLNSFQDILIQATADQTIGAHEQQFDKYPCVL